MPGYAAFGIAICCVVLLVGIKRSLGKKLPLPPGPPAEPFIGHLRQIPQEHQADTFFKWGKIHGDVMHLHVPGRSMVILNSVQAALDLLDKRSSNYSDRPKFVIFEIMGWVSTTTFLRYGEQWRTHRKILQDYFKRSEIPSFHHIQRQEAHALIKNLVKNSGDHDASLSRFSTGMLMRILYGHRITSDDDIYLQIAKESSYANSNAGSAGNTPVDVFPVLRYFPSWFPGAYYAGFAREWNHAVRKLHDFPYDTVRRLMAKGSVEPSFLASQLETSSDESSVRAYSPEDIKGVAAAIYGAGTDTMWSSLSIFLLAMVLHPECQAKAQEEIDTVIGIGRLPDFADRPSLPYVESVLQESLRWNSALPLGVPHCSLEDDVYRGMLIPKGSLIIANTRGMALDETVYTDPHKFQPTRFLPKPRGNEEPHPIASFGFGRRICPGRHFADASLWIAVASIFSTLAVSKAIGDDGKEIIPDAIFSSGISSHPIPYQCRIRYRSEEAQALLMQANLWDC